MTATTFDAPTLITTGIVLTIALVLAFRLLNKDSSVRRTRWGFFVERDHYTEEEGEPELPLPPPTPPPPLPPRGHDDEPTQTWPTRPE